LTVPDEINVGGLSTRFAPTIRINGVSACWKVNGSPPLGPCIEFISSWCFGCGQCLDCVCFGCGPITMHSHTLCVGGCSTFLFWASFNIDVVVFCCLSSCGSKAPLSSCLPSLLEITTERDHMSRRTHMKHAQECSECSFCIMPILVLSRGFLIFLLPCV